MDSHHDIAGLRERGLTIHEADPARGSFGPPLPLSQSFTRACEAPAELSFFEVHTDDGDLLVLGFRHAPVSRPSALSSSERVVVALALEGKSNVEIGRARDTSARTVANQLASAFRKLGVSSRRELATVLPVGRGWGATRRAPP